MNLSDVVVNSIMVILGFVLGLLGVPIVEYFRNRYRRKKLAMVLSDEIRHIHSQAVQMVPIHEDALRKTEKTTTHPGSPQNVVSIDGMAIADRDFPTELYHAFLNDIGLLDADTISCISDLYVWIGSAKNFKIENNKSELDLNSFVASTSGRTLSDFEVISLQIKGQTSIHYAKAYVKCLHTIVQLSNEALNDLGKIARTEPHRRSVDSFDETMRETFGTH